MKPLYKWLIAIAVTFVAFIIVMVQDAWWPERHPVLMCFLLIITPGIIVWYVLDEFCDPDKVSP